MLLLQNKAFDAELSMAGIFEVTSIARESILEAVTLGRLLLLPALLTDEGAGPEIPNLNLWKSFLRQCHGLWLDVSRCPWSSVDFYGHGDAVQLNLEVSRSELAALCEFPSRPWRDAFEAGFGSLGNAGRATNLVVDLDGRRQCPHLFARDGGTQWTQSTSQLYRAWLRPGEDEFL